MRKRIFGDVPGFPPGTHFKDRIAVSKAGVHCPTQHGISGSQRDGADSIVVSGGYQDDEDHGDVIIYTGFGGRDESTGRQIADQDFIHQNLALKKSWENGLPVRVVRGFRLRSPYRPRSGYRYDGVYYVEECWREDGQSGYKVCRFKLVGPRPQLLPL